MIIWIWTIGAVITALALISSQDDGDPCSWSDVGYILFAILICSACWPAILGIFLGRIMFLLDKLAPYDKNEGKE